MHNKSAEESIIACLLISFEDCKDSYYLLNENYFEEPLCSEIFLAIKKCFSNKKPIDVVTVMEYILVEDETKIKIARMVEILPTTSNHRQYAEIVKKNYIKRLLHQKINMVLNDIETSEVYETSSTIKQISDDCLNLLSTSKDNDFECMAKTYIENLKNGGADDVIFTGWNNFDKGFGGFTKGEVFGVAGRPGMGKTTFALNMATKLRKQGYKILFNSLEMSETQLLNKIISIELGINSNNIRYNNLSEALVQQIEDLLSNYKNFNIVTDAYTTSKLQEKIISNMSDIVIIDYLQYMQPQGKYSNRTSEIGEISRSLKFLAKELGIVIILISQLSRELEKRAIKQPMLSDLRDSGEIEQDIAGCIFVHRDSQYDSDIDEKDTKIIVAKNRFGKSNVVFPFRFDLDIQKFFETDNFNYEPPF